MKKIFVDNKSKVLYNMAKEREECSFGYVAQDTLLKAYYEEFAPSPCIIVQDEGNGLDDTIYIRAWVCPNASLCSGSPHHEDCLMR